jgi:hypothetical protein
MDGGMPLETCLNRKGGEGWGTRQIWSATCNATTNRMLHPAAASDGTGRMQMNAVHLCPVTDIAKIRRAKMIATFRTNRRALSLQR